MRSIEGQETHILMVTLPFQGHINQMLKFAKHLAPMNIHFTLATTEQARNLLSAATATSDEPCSLVDLAFFSDGLPEDDPRSDESLLESLRNVGSKNLSKIIDEKKFSCIISSPFTPWAPSVAIAHDIPSAILWTQACGAYSVYYHYFKKTKKFPNFKKLNRKVRLPDLPLLEVQDLPSFLFPSGGSHLYKLMEDFVNCLGEVHWVFSNSFYELEPEITESMSDHKHIIPIGPLVSPFLLRTDEDKTLAGDNVDMCKSDDHCMEWLDKQEKSSVVYISFGSTLQSSENQVKSIATTLRNRGVSFIWVIRLKERGENVFILQEMVNTGKGLVIEWGPQERILSHVATSCFIMHCGWTSTLEIVAAGVPVVAYPRWADQPFNAKLIVDAFEIGVRMRNNAVDGELKVEEVERCIEALTEGPSAADMRRRAVELKRAARSAMAPGGSSAKNLEYLIEDITTVM